MSTIALPRRLFRLSVPALALILVAGCGPPPPRSVSPPKPPPAPEPTEPVQPRGKVVLEECEPPQAQVTVDGEPLGTVAEINEKGGLVLPQGVHRLEIALQGYLPFRVEFNLGEQPERLKVSLKPAPPP